MFAIGFFLEREPLSLAQVPGALLIWLQNAGAAAGLGLALWCIAYYVQHRGQSASATQAGAGKRQPLFIALLGIVFLLYVAAALWFIAREIGLGGESARTSPIGDTLMALAGGAAILTVLFPLLGSLFWRM